MKEGFPSLVIVACEEFDGNAADILFVECFEHEAGQNKQSCNSSILKPFSY